MKKVVVSSFLIIALFICILTPVSVLAEEETLRDSSIQNGCRSFDAQQSLLGASQLIPNAESVFLYETKSETLMYAWNADARVHPSSLVKITTAIVAIELGNLEDIVTVKKETLSTIPSDAASSDLVEGEKISLRDLLYCMMVDSANDAAAVIAEHISGSQNSFVEKMNKLATDIGCKDTQFTNVHGLHDPQQYTTARDLAKLLGHALKNDDFKEIFSATEYTVKETNKSQQRNLLTGNFLMTTSGMEIYFDDRVTGGRTGTAADGTRCLAATAEGNDMQMISIVTGSKSVVEKDGYSVSVFGSFKETSQLLDAGLNGFRYAQVLYNGQVMDQKELPGAECNLIVGCGESVNAIVPLDASKENLTYRYSQDSQTIPLPVSKGSSVGTVEVWYKDLCLAQSALYAMNRVNAEGDITVDHDRTGSAVWVTVLICVLSAIFLCVAVLFVRNRYLTRFRRRRHRR